MIFIKLLNAIRYQAGVKSPKPTFMYIPMKNIKFIEQCGNDIKIHLRSGELIIESDRNIDNLLIRKNIIYDYYNPKINDDVPFCI